MSNQVPSSSYHSLDSANSDLGRPKQESSFLEINPLIKEVIEVHKSVEKWAKPESAPFSLNFAAMKPVIRKVCYGVACPKHD